MNPLPAPSVPGNTEFQRFDNLFRKIIAVPKSPVVDPPKRKQPKNRAKKR